MSGFSLKILVVLFLIINISYAQENKLLRIELDAKENEYPYDLIPLQDNGMIMFYRTANTVSASEINWYFSFYDVNLKKGLSKEIPINDKLSYKKNVISRDTIFLFFQDISKKNRINNYSIIVIDIVSKAYQVINGIFPDKGIIDDFQIFGNKAFFSFQSDDEYATLLSRNLRSDKTEDLFYNERGILEIEKIIIDSASTSLNLILKKSIAKKQYGLFYYELEMDGEIIDSIQIKPDIEGKQLKKGMLYIDGDDKIIIGTYLNIKGKSSKQDSDPDNESSGIFFTNFKNNIQQSIRYYSYLDFRNFSVYLSDADLMKYKRKLEKKEKKGKDFSINYKLLVHDIIRHNDQYIFSAEAYYPEYHTVSYMSYDYYGRAVPQYYSVFDGYRYTNALIASFDKNGEVQWSNIFDMLKIISFSLKERVNCFFDGDDIILSYTENGQIASEIINGADVVGELEHTDIATSHSNDVIVEDKRSEMEHWYNNNFIIYGYQTIKNNYLSGKRKRTVFYVNKIAFE